MKKITLFFLLIINIYTFSKTNVTWNVEKGISHNEIEVTCNLFGDLYKTFNVNVTPFNSPFSDGSDSDYSSEITMKVEKQLPYDDEVAYYEAYLEKNYEKLASFEFKVRNVLIIEN